MLLTLHATDYRARLHVLTSSARLRLAVLLVVTVMPALWLFAWLQTEASAPGVQPQVGSPAPPVSLELLYGGETSLAQQRGNVLVMNFWATWCDTCRADAPALQQVADDLQAERFTVYEVDIEEDAATIDPVRQQLGLRMPILLDAREEVARQYGAGAPATFVVDQQGVLRYAHLGPLSKGDAQTPWSTAWLEQQARSLLESG